MSELSIFVPVLGRALLHFLSQGAVIGLVAALLLQVLRDARSQARYAVACLALLACALAPLVDIAWQLADAPAVAAAPLAPTVAFAPALGHATQALVQAWRPGDALPLVVALWAAGACVLSLRMALGVWWIRRLCASSHDDASATWQARLDALATRFGLRRPVALRLVDTLASPASVGWWKPVVLLPTALLARMPVELVEALLAHELAHIRRHDYLVNLLQGAVEALLFYHPVTWWLSRRIRVEREHIADRLAADATGEPRRLAVALAELSELSASLASANRLPSLALAAHGGHLMSRIEQLVRPRPQRSAGGRIAFPLLGLAAACLAFLAHAQSAQVAKPVAGKAPTTQVEKAHVIQHGGVADVAQRTAYALVRKDRSDITMSGSVGDAEGIEAMRGDIGSDFLWYRKDNRAWIIVDPATIARAERAWAPMEKLDAQMDALDAQMEGHEHNMDALEAQMDQLSDRADEHPGLDAAAQRMEDLGRQQEAIGARQEKLAEAMARADEAQQAQLDRDMDALSAQQDALGAQMEAQSRVAEAESAKLAQQTQPMEALSKRMEEAAKPMEALGRQMDALGKQIDEQSAQAERETLKAIDEAMAKGLAKPAPARE